MQFSSVMWLPSQMITYCISPTVLPQLNVRTRFCDVMGQNLLVPAKCFIHSYSANSRHILLCLIFYSCHVVVANWLPVPGFLILSNWLILEKPVPGNIKRH